MSSRELRQLNADNEARLSRPVNQGQAILLQRRRSSQRQQGRPSTNDDHRDMNAVSTRRGGLATAPQRHTGQEESGEKRRSPLRPAPAEPSTSTEESSRDGGRPVTGDQPSTSDPEPIRRSREVPSTSRAPAHPVNGLFNSFTRLQRIGAMTPPPQAMPQVQPPAPPAQNLPVQGRQQPQPSRRTLQIQNLPTRAITSQEGAQSCVICMTEYKSGEQVTVLPCDHIYHQECISTWLRSNPQCPLCRSHCFQ